MREQPILRMEPERYMQAVQRTNAPLEGGRPIEFNDVLHGAMGIVTEAGELMDMLKRFYAYRAPFDRINALEEIDDILWYIAIILNALESDFEREMQRNIDKLRKRFPEKFTQHDALNRDLESERNTLERGYK